MNRKNLYGCIAGTLLGDSWLQVRGKSYSIGTENVSLDLVQYKKKIFEEFSHKQIKMYTRPPRQYKLHARYGYSNGSYAIHCTSPKLAYFSRIAYDGTKKIMTRRLLDRLTPQGIALWFMDDGCYVYTEKNSTRRMYLCTDSFSEQEIHTASRYFLETWNIRSSIKTHKSSKYDGEKLRLKFGGREIQKLATLMYPYMLESFMYKVNVIYEREGHLIPEYIPIHRQLVARNIRKNEDIVHNGSRVFS